MERQYIGARYVPKFADPFEWQNNRTYESLTIVTYLGATYTSKKTVPAGVKPTDANYWVCTGNYNQQVEAYRQELVAALAQVDEKLAEANANVNSVKEEVDKIDRNRLNGKNILVVGDSTCDESTGTPNWVHHLREKMVVNGGTVTNIAKNGHKIQDQLTILKTTNVTDIDIIILLLGTNNINDDWATVKQDIVAMCDYIHDLNKEAHWITPLTTTESSHVNSNALYSALSDYIANSCKYYGIHVIDGCELPMLSPSNSTYMPDLIHPSSNYANIMCDFVYEKVSHYGGGYFTKSALHLRLDNQIEVYANDVKLETETASGAYQEFGNGMCFISCGCGGVQFVNGSQNFKVRINNDFLARLINENLMQVCYADCYSSNIDRVRVRKPVLLFNNPNTGVGEPNYAELDFWVDDSFLEGEKLNYLTIKIIAWCNTPTRPQRYV